MDQEMQPALIRPIDSEMAPSRPPKALLFGFDLVLRHRSRRVAITYTSTCTTIAPRRPGKKLVVVGGVQQRRGDRDREAEQRAAQRQRGRVVALADQQHLVIRRDPRVNHEKKPKPAQLRQKVQQIV
jgi:hypothetical protein